MIKFIDSHLIEVVERRMWRCRAGSEDSTQVTVFIDLPKTHLQLC